MSHNPNESSETPPKLAQKTPLSDPTQAASSSSAASEPSNANTARFIMTDTTPKRENVYASIDKNLNIATNPAWLTWRPIFITFIEIIKIKTCIVLKIFAVTCKI